MSEKNNFNIMVVDDEPEYLSVLSLILEDNGYSVVTCIDGQKALDRLKAEDIDLMITDLRMPGINGIDLIKKVHSNYPNVSIMVMTAYGAIDTAVEAIKSGAGSYFVKGSDPAALLGDISKQVEICNLKRSNELLKESANTDKPLLETRNAAMKQIMEICNKAASSGVSILLEGESGTGKEVLARYIHDISHRKGNFVAVNCQEFSENMIESELFGHEKGAFTGAVNKRIGRFEYADGGTLFLDEIGDLPLSIQGKLLRTLETHEISRIGSNRSIKLDIRLIAATNKDIRQKIKDGSFREDLLYRINTLEIEVPPLRKRREDMESLICLFLKIAARDQKKTIDTISEDTMSDLMSYDYPGNVRELKNAIERLVLMCDGTILTGRIVRDARGQALCESEASNTLKSARDHFEKIYIEQILLKCNQNIKQTASALGISERQLWNKISEYNIPR